MAPLSDKEHEQLRISLGNLALKKGFISAADLAQALIAHSHLGKTDTRPDFGQFLAEKGFLTQEQVLWLLAMATPADVAPDRVRSHPSPPPIDPPGDFPAREAPPASSRLGKYALLGELGHGGMGVVYEALDTELDRKVALKLPQPSAARRGPENDLENQRFVREAKLAARLPKHPYIAGVYEAGVIDGRRYISMELIPGQTLSQVLKDRAVPFPRKIKLLRDVALALQFAHDHGVIHRDLKPENVVVSDGFEPRVMDFGLAKAVGDQAISLTPKGAIVGSPAYMSPEQAQRLKSIDGRTDVYSLGVMLYETLTGRRPFGGRGAVDTLMQALTQPARPPSTQLSPGISIAVAMPLEKICLRAMQKDPNERWPSAQAMADALSEWLKEWGGSDTSVPAPSIKRKRWLTALVGILLFVGLLALGYYWKLLRRTP
jgi:serine/threonine protein kinase